MHKQLLPRDASVGVHCEHAANQLFAGRRNDVNALRKLELLVLDVVHEIDHVRCIIWRPA